MRARLQPNPHLVHFLVIGAALFGFEAWLGAARIAEQPPVRREPILIQADQVEQILSNAARTAKRVLTREEEAALVQRAVEDEILYREALARGLDRYDRSIRYRMIQNMRFLSDEPIRQEQDLYREALELGLDRDDTVVRRILIHKLRLIAKSSADRDELSETQIREYFSRHLSEYLEPARVTLSHVFLSAQKRGEKLQVDAEGLLHVLRSRSMPLDRAIGLGDAFPLGQRVRSASKHDLEKLYGASFAEAVMTSPPGSWQGPVRSGYGLHLVWIESRQPAREPSLASVHSQIARHLREQRRDAGLRRFVSRLREMYTVQVEYPAGRGA